jgi:Spore Coat Protein U domain
MNRWLVRSMALALAWLADPAQAACKGGLTAGVAPVVSYDPFDGEIVMTATVNAVRNNTSCTPALIITSTASQGAERTVRQGSATLAYAITNASAQVWPNNASSALAIIIPTTDQPAAQTLVVRMAAGQFASTGTYSDVLDITLVDAARDNEPITADQGMVNRLSVPVTVTVPSKAQVNIAGSAGSFGTFALTTLDFGELQQGTARNAFVQVRATTSMRVSVTSANGGALERLGTTYRARVAYALTLGGTDLPLAAGTQSLRVDQPATVDGESLPLLVTLTGATESLPAGTYQDVLTVDVVPD